MDQVKGLRGIRVLGLSWGSCRDSEKTEALSKDMEGRGEIGLPYKPQFKRIQVKAS